ncbi:MAG: class E sortase [Actinomycetota bacterium]|nr:class E sortase [Actinomycetota bacterium]
MRKRTKTLILTIAIVVLIGGGLSLLLYPFVTNLIASRQEARQLEEWQQQAESIEQQDSEEPIETNEEAVSEQEPEQTEEEEAIIEWSEEISGQTVPHEEPAVEDYFPAKITIPSIEVEAVAYEGTDRETLKQGPGHIIGTPFPGEVGRCTISGHRTTDGAPFNRVDELVEGDLIYIDTVSGDTFVYTVTSQEIVRPTDVHVLEGNDKKELLLTACHPKYSAAYRIIIYAELVNIYPIGELS